MVIRWEFMTEEGDLMFKLYYYDGKGEKADLLPLERVECHLCMEEGEINCTGGRTCKWNTSFACFQKQKEFMLYSNFYIKN